MTDSSAPLLEVTGLTKRFGDTLAIDDVSVQIRHNEFFALLGPSGCGKTTLLRSIAGFEQPDSGAITIAIDGQKVDLLRLRPEARPINLMFQSYALFPHMSVEKNIGYGLAREGVSRDEIRERVAQVLRTVDLSNKAAMRPAQLSGGQRQRVALARAIVKRPRLLLLDEPLSALDRKVRAEMQLELKRLQHEVGITFVVVTHDQEEAMSMADRIAVMGSGRVHQIASPLSLYQRPESLFVADFIGTSNKFGGVAESDGVRVGHRLLPGVLASGRVGAPAQLIVRPEDTWLTTKDEAFLSGQVLDTQFYGGNSTVAVGVEGQDAPVLHTRPGAPETARGAIVHIRWNPEKAVVLADQVSS